MKLYPLTFRPVYKDYIWGGSRIPKLFERELPESVYAESWEISAHPDGMSVVSDGEFSGRTLAELTLLLGRDLLGRRTPANEFPLLIKLIDAAQPLSVQVHPNERTAPLTGGDPKTEMWYFLEGCEDAEVYCGLNPGISRSQFEAALKAGTVGSLLRSVPARSGEAVFVPGGRVHAIGAGCMILEVQQSSNTTYRVYDWNRTGADGKPRELHVEQSLLSIDFDDLAEPLTEIVPFGESGRQGECICRSDFFVMDRFRGTTPFVTDPAGETFQVLFAESGSAELAWDGGRMDCGTGMSVLLPASMHDVKITPKGADFSMLRISLPESEQRFQL